MAVQSADHEADDEDAPGNDPSVVPDAPPQETGRTDLGQTDQSCEPRRVSEARHLRDRGSGSGQLGQAEHQESDGQAELENQRKRYVKGRGDLPGKVTMTVLIVKALAGALKAYPQVNASVDTQAGQVIFKQYYHIGIAVDTGTGLIVPVIRDVDQKGILELAVELEDMSARARERKIKLEELQGGSFTISNLGGIGGTAFSPIVNYPQAAILGVARSRQEYVMHNGKPEFRLMMPLCLSYDHRIIDGADAVRFTRHLADILSNPFQLFLG